MTQLDSTLVIDAISKCLDTASSERQRTILTTLIRHMRAETIEPDLDTLMSTVGADPRYHSWGSAPRDAAPKGRASVRDFYDSFLTNVGHEVEFQVERVAVSDDLVAMDGTVRRIFPGTGLPHGDAAGVSIAGREIDPDAFYLWETRMACFFSFDETGLLEREDTYATGASEVFRKLAGTEVAARQRRKAK